MVPCARSIYRFIVHRRVNRKRMAVHELEIDRSDRVREGREELVDGAELRRAAAHTSGR